MDKSANNLDPKLKEAYDRIMGTSFAPQKTAPLPPPVMKTETVTTPEPQAQSPKPAAPQSLGTVFSQTAPAEKNKSNLMPIVFVLGGIVFLVIYAVLWGKIFNLF